MVAWIKKRIRRDMSCVWRRECQARQRNTCAVMKVHPRMIRMKIYHVLYYLHIPKSMESWVKMQKKTNRKQTLNVSEQLIQVFI